MGGLARLQIRTDGDALHPEHDPIIEATARDRDLFADPERLILLVRSRPGAKPLFSPSGLAQLRSLTERIRRVPGVLSDDVVALPLTLDVSATSETLHLGRFLDTAPATPEEVAALRERLERTGLYGGLLYARDWTSTALYLPLSGVAGRGETLARVRDALAADESPDLDVRVGGPVAAEVLLGEQIVADLTRLVPLLIAVIGLALFLCLRSAAAAAVPLVEVVFALGWTMGTMAWLGVPITLPTSVLPVLIMVFAVTDEIFMLERFRSRLAAGADRAAALAGAYRDVGNPIIGASLTTAAAELAFTTASVPPLRHFGLFGALGIVYAMILSFTLVPALVMVMPARWFQRAGAAPARETDPLERWVVATPRGGWIVVVATLAVASLGLRGLRVQDSWVENFDSGAELVEAESIFSEQYQGSYRLDLTLGHADDAFFRRPEGCALIDSIQTVVAALPDVGGTRSAVDLVRLALREMAPASTLRQLDESSLAQLFLLLEMAGRQRELERLLVPSARESRVLCYVRSADYAKAKRLIARVEELRGPLAARGVSLRVTGDLAVATRVVRSIVANQLRSIGFTLAALTILIALALRSARLGLITLFPVAATCVLLFGAMGYAGVPLGIATSMFAAVTVGAGVDFAIHFVSRYRDLHRLGNRDDAIGATFASAGRAIRWNAIILVGGCLVLAASSLKPDRALGALLAAGFAASYGLACLALPQLLLWWEKSEGPGRRGCAGSSRRSER